MSCEQLGILAVLIRQTNIIWILFVACTGIVDITLSNRREDKKVDGFDLSIKENYQSTASSNSNSRKRKAGSTVLKNYASVAGRNEFSVNQKSGSVHRFDYGFINL